MGDTTRGWFPKTECSDCGDKGCIIHHNGPLVPSGDSGSFCRSCALVRKEDYDAGRPPKLIGYRMKVRA
ncbi:MAG: hypothetical protein PHG66_02135 [Candidatus Colwellbacteria bacterium]|nr:hypothetical protein [Candidatus Colwellbacteria bacterium]